MLWSSVWWEDYKVDSGICHYSLDSSRDETMFITETECGKAYWLLKLKDNYLEMQEKVDSNRKMIIPEKWEKETLSNTHYLRRRE